jgi:hypothetical protein
MSRSTSLRFDLGYVSLRLSFCFSIYLALFAVCVFGQQGTTSLRGTILDKSGASISGATVTLTNAEQAVQRSVTSSDTGAYEFVSLPQGRTRCAWRRAGFVRTIRKTSSCW